MKAIFKLMLTVLKWFLIILFVITLGLTAIGYRQAHVPKGYDIAYYNEGDRMTKYLLKKNHSGDNVMMFDGIVDYYTKGDYILMLDMKIIINDTRIEYTDQASFWAVHYKTGEKIGPMNEGEFNNFLRMHNLGNVNLKIPKYYLQRIARSGD